MSRRGRAIGDPIRKPVTIDGVLYASQSDAARKLGVSQSRLSARMAKYGDVLPCARVEFRKPVTKANRPQNVL